jgi:hypothetical protein
MKRTPVEPGGLMECGLIAIEFISDLNVEPGEGFFYWHFVQISQLAARRTRIPRAKSAAGRSHDGFCA